MKKLLMFCLADVLILVIATALFAGQAPPKLQNHGLKSDFLEYNEKYFYGALPSNTTVSWGDLSEWNDMGRTDRRSDGSYLIQVDPKYHTVLRQARMTLLHEMCHEKNMLHINVILGTTRDESEGLNGHDDENTDAHDTCMVDLAKRGAFKNLW